jgi:hypothetical protein
MQNVILRLVDVPMVRMFILAGILFLFIAVVGKIEGKIEPGSIDIGAAPMDRGRNSEKPLCCCRAACLRSLARLPSAPGVEQHPGTCRTAMPVTTKASATAIDYTTIRPCWNPSPACSKDFVVEEMATITPPPD